MLIPLSFTRRFERAPHATYVLIGLTTTIYWLTQDSSFEALRPYMADPRAFSPFTAVTSVFMHASFMHLVGNLIYLWIFGPYAEDRVGGWRFVVLYLTFGACADLAYAADPGSVLPSLGASGAIAGLMGLVFFAAPKAHVRVLFWYFMAIRTLVCPVWILLGVWIIGQLLLLRGGAGNINVLAHVGGFLAGMLAQLLLRQRFFSATGWSFPREDVTSIRDRKIGALQRDERMFEMLDQQAGRPAHPERTPGAKPGDSGDPTVYDITPD